MAAKERRSQIGLIILSIIDLAFGILSIAVSAMSVQILAAMASGLTLCKAIKISIQSKKAADLVKRVAVKAIPIVLRTISSVSKINNEEKTTMKNFFKKLRTNVKNNKITTVVVVFIALLCAGGGYAVNYFLTTLSCIPNPYNIVLAVVVTVFVFILLAVAVIYLGHDSETWARIRKYVKFLGGESAADKLDELQQAVLKEQAEAEANAEAEAKQREEDDRIYQQICEEEAAQERALRAAKIAEWKARHQIVEPVSEAVSSPTVALSDSTVSQPVASITVAKYDAGN